MGVKDELWLTMSKTPSETMRYLDHVTLNRWQLLTDAVTEVPDISLDYPEVSRGGKEALEWSNSFVRVSGKDAPALTFLECHSKACPNYSAKYGAKRTVSVPL